VQKLLLPTDADLRANLATLFQGDSVTTLQDLRLFQLNLVAALLYREVCVERQIVKCPAIVGWAFAPDLFFADCEAFKAGYPDVFTQCCNTVCEQ
jgi:hypothetical protein